MELIAKLNANGKKVAVVSNKFYEATQDLVRHFFGEEIKVAIGERPDIHKKPAPDTVIEALRQLDMPSSTAVYIGDSDVDIDTARNCGMPCISVLWGFRDRDFLIEHGATTHLDHAHYTCMDCNAYVIDPEGYIYKCWSDVGLENRRIGDLRNGIKNFDIVAQFMTGSDKFSDKKCLDCSFIPICEGSCNLYRVCFLEKGIPYEVCDIDKDCLVKLLEIYYESKDEK